MFVDLLQRRVFKGFISAFLKPCLVDPTEAGLVFTIVMPASFLRNGSAAPTRPLNSSTADKKHPVNKRRLDIGLLRKASSRAGG